IPSTTTDTTTIMTASPTRASTLISNLSAVTARIATATAKYPTPRTKPFRLVAVSKLKPSSDILALYNPRACHVLFGENYVEVLLE
ncbi:hypothetical protein L6232_25135, partial [Shewanella sp. C31]|nr:hypothetical protein [Shewanella electrica]